MAAKKKKLGFKHGFRAGLGWYLGMAISSVVILVGLCAITAFFIVAITHGALSQ